MEKEYPQITPIDADVNPNRQWGTVCSVAPAPATREAKLCARMGRLQNDPRGVSIISFRQPRPQGCPRLTFVTAEITADPNHTLAGKAHPCGLNQDIGQPFPTRPGLFSPISLASPPIDSSPRVCPYTIFPGRPISFHKGTQVATYNTSLIPFTLPSEQIIIVITGVDANKPRHTHG